MKILTFFLSFLMAANFISATIKSYNSKIDPYVLFYMNKDNLKLPEGIRLSDPFTDRNGNVLVEIVKNRSLGTQKRGNFPTLEKHARNLAAQIIRVKSDRIECRATGKNLLKLAENPEVKKIRLPLRPILNRTDDPSLIDPDYYSEGVDACGANKWHPVAPYYGNKKVKICILDGGFRFYKDLLGKYLPEKVITKSFREDGDIEAGEEHGTACAEIVHAMAPEAEMYLVNIDTFSSFIEAMKWIVEQKIDIVSHSLGWINSGPGNGKCPVNKVVDEAISQGVTFITSAGNSATSQWRGFFNDTDGNGYHNFEDGSEMLTIAGGTPDGSWGSAYLSWDDWGTYDEATGEYSGTAEDYDIHLFAKIDEAYWKRIPAPSRNQDGDDPPTESAEGYAGKPTYRWGVKIFRKKASKKVELTLLVPSTGFEGFPSDRSLNAPADGKNTVAVGAVGWKDNIYHKYSSQGPTYDGRIKPDITAYSGVKSRVYSYGGFGGTSASTPHVSGAIALLMSKTPFSAKEIVEILKARAIDMGDPGADNKYGIGVMTLED